MKSKPQKLEDYYKRMARMAKYHEFKALAADSKPLASYHNKVSKQYKDKIVEMRAVEKLAWGRDCCPIECRY